jgi:DNA-binding MarR family transcriptional regulator
MHAGALAPNVSPLEVARLRAGVRQFVKAFGLLSTDRTPCGTPISLSCAYALVHLLEAGRIAGAPTQRELARTLHVDKSTVARLCAKMERDGLVLQRRDEHDARVRRLSLTARGRRLAERVETASHARHTELLAAVPVSARASLLRGLETLSAAASTLAEAS